MRASACAEVFILAKTSSTNVTGNILTRLEGILKGTYNGSCYSAVDEEKAVFKTWPIQCSMLMFCLAQYFCVKGHFPSLCPLLKSNTSPTSCKSLNYRQQA